MPSNKISVVLTELQYARMMRGIDEGQKNYTFDEIRAFIRRTRTEQFKNQDKLKAYVENKVYPEYIKDAGAWYHGLTLENNKLKVLRSKAILIRDAMK